MQFVLGEILRNTRHVLWGPCKDVSILTEEVDELAFLFTVQVCTNDCKPFRVLRVQRYLLRLLGRLEGALCIIIFGVWDKAGYLPAMATTRSSIFFSSATTRDSASRLLAATHSMDFL